MSVPAEFEAFFEKVFEGLVAALWLYCGDRGVAEECAQEALARVARDWERVSRMASPGGWTHRVAFNQANSLFRRRRTERRAVERLASSSIRGNTDDAGDISEQLVVRRAVLGLPSRQRQAIVLFYFLDRPVAEVAEAMNVPVNTVKSWLSRARAALERDLAPGEPRTSQEDADVR